MRSFQLISDGNVVEVVLVSLPFFEQWQHTKVFQETYKLLEKKKKVPLLKKSKHVIYEHANIRRLAEMPDKETVTKFET